MLYQNECIARLVLLDSILDGLGKVCQALCFDTSDLFLSEST
jgi:hypothetical protein